VQCEAVLGEAIRDQIERLTWSLWHGQVDKALGKIDDLETAMEPFRETYARFPQQTWPRHTGSSALLVKQG